MLGGKYGSASVRLNNRFGHAGSKAAEKNQDELALDQISRQSFGFRTPNKKGAMMDRVLLSAGSGGPASKPGSSSATMTPTARRAVLNR